eukprot:TRINITY_DN121111_c0_g1_i1.p1 TRINITY_DN121111_c0_g1~~TRINITY_DN121111_c0_g1_i1.p1  ORF type:complete len:690 (+),score=172.05 TRINITY_DN121111_c0_g1_i1:137-2206(+)
MRLPDVWNRHSRDSPGHPAEDAADEDDDPLFRGGHSKLYQRRKEIEAELRRELQLEGNIFDKQRLAQGPPQGRTGSVPFGRPPPVPKPRNRTVNSRLPPIPKPAAEAPTRPRWGAVEEELGSVDSRQTGGSRHPAQEEDSELEDVASRLPSSRRHAESDDGSELLSPLPKAKRDYPTTSVLNSAEVSTEAASSDQSSVGHAEGSSADHTSPGTPLGSDRATPIQQRPLLPRLSARPPPVPAPTNLPSTPPGLRLQAGSITADAERPNFQTGGAAPSRERPASWRVKRSTPFTDSKVIDGRSTPHGSQSEASVQGSRPSSRPMSEEPGWKAKARELEELARQRREARSGGDAAAAAREAARQQEEADLQADLEMKERQRQISEARVMEAQQLEAERFEEIRQREMRQRQKETEETRKRREEQEEWERDIRSRFAKEAEIRREAQKIEQEEEAKLREKANADWERQQELRRQTKERDERDRARRRAERQAKAEQRQREQFDEAERMYRRYQEEQRSQYKNTESPTRRYTESPSPPERPRMPPPPASGPFAAGRRQGADGRNGFGWGSAAAPPPPPPGTRSSHSTRHTGTNANAPHHNGPSGSQRTTTLPPVGSFNTLPETNPHAEQIRQAQVAANQQLRQLKALPSLEARQKGFKALLRSWHPDKNPKNVEVATAVFQMVQAEKPRVLDGF